MPKPVKRVSEVRPRQAVFAASIKQFPERLVMLTEGDSWFSYPLNANIADYIEMMNDFSILRLEHNGDEARDILGAGSEQLKKLKYYLKNYPVDLLLMSAGGNDLVARELARVMGVEPALETLTVDQVQMKAQRPRFCALSNDKLAAAGFRMPSWQDAITRWLATRDGLTQIN